MPISEALWPEPKGIGCDQSTSSWDGHAGEPLSNAGYAE